MPEGSIDLPFTAGEPPCQITLIVSFLVVRCPSTYNAIIGRPTLNNLRAVTSTYHLKVKFPTPAGPGVLRGNQYQARQCYALALRGRH